MTVELIFALATVIASSSPQAEPPSLPVHPIVAPASTTASPPAAPEPGAVPRGVRVDPPEPEGTGGPTFTGHWGIRWTRLYEDGARLAGGGIGVLLGRDTRVELVGFGTVTPSRYSTLDFRLAYGGLQVGRELWRSGRWSLDGTTLVGGGSFSVEDRPSGDEDRTGVWLAEPGLSLGVHLGGHLRIAAGAGYRWVGGIEGDIPNRSDGDAASGSFGLIVAVR